MYMNTELYVQRSRYRSTLTACERIDIRNKLYERQEGHCDYCDRIAHNGDPNLPLELLATLEHVIPVSQNGTDDISNLSMACKDCNETRGAMDADEFHKKYSNPSGGKKADVKPAKQESEAKIDQKKSEERYING